MVNVHCHTNLDMPMGFDPKWPTELPARPMVGDFIESPAELRDGAVLRLKVYAITWVKSKSPILSGSYWICNVELHLNATVFPTISLFDVWMEYHTGRISQEIYSIRYDRAFFEYLAANKRSC